MDFQGKQALVFLEEDNIQRAYFRIRPLLTCDEAISSKVTASFPDDGYLRIVPDKNEQHTFKDRMRTICGLCIIDLTEHTGENGKIRNNKNYAPQRGETNQFIIYSDAVRAMPERLMYQVVPEDEIPKAHTPLVYKRDGCNIFGPVRRSDGAFEGETLRLQPDSREIHTVTLPNGKELLFYWPKPIEKPIEKKEQLSAPAIIKQLNEPVSANGNLLKPAAPDSQIDDKPTVNYNGTKLYQGVKPKQLPRRAYNPLIETVEQQRYAARYESPGAVLNDASSLKDVDNPVETFRAALQGVWGDPNTHQQAVSILLSMSGMKALLAKSVDAEHNDLAIAAMHSQLNELEAERLMTLMRLDEAKKDLSVLRKEAVASAAREEQERINALHADAEASKAALSEIKEQIADLTAERAEIAEKINQYRHCRLVSPVVGGEATREKMIERVKDCLTARGFKTDEDDACAALLTFALSEGAIGIQASSREDAAFATSAIAHALGGVWCAPKALDIRAARTADDTPIFINATFHVDLTLSIEGATTWVLPDRYHGLLPVLRFTPDPLAYPTPLPDCPPLSEKSVRIAMLAGATQPGEEAMQLIKAIRETLANAGAPLPLKSAGKLIEFVSVAQNVMRGGVASALDYGVAIYVVPHIKAQEIDAAAYKTLFAALPQALKAL